MSSILKHIGKYGEKKCVVVMRQLDGDPESCLIVQPDGLSERQHDDLMEVIQSPEAQNTNDVSQVLHRRQFSDGGIMLSVLHYGKKLQKVPVSQVSLTPLPNQSISLAEVNEAINQIEGGYVPPKNDESHLRSEDVPRPTLNEGTNLETDPALNAERIDSGINSTINGDDPAAIARNLLAQADLLAADAKALQADAKAKQAEAYKLDPSLKPKSTKSPAKKASDKTA